MTGNGTHQVIRTKAVRCTKVFLPPQEGEPMIQTDLELGHNEISPLISPSDDDCLNFLMDFDMGEMFVSDILDSEFIQVSGDEIQEKSSGTCGDEGGIHPSVDLDDRFSFGEALLDDWRDSNSIQDSLGLEIGMLDLP